MARRTPVFIVCSPRPRVGKTLLARLLTEFYRAESGRWRPSTSTRTSSCWSTTCPATHAVPSIDDTPGQIALFDQLIVADEFAKVVDLG